jgi:hypothetical protein
MVGRIDQPWTVVGRPLGNMRDQPREGPADCGGQQGRADVSGRERCAPCGPSQVPSFGCRPLEPCPPRGPPCSCRPPPRPCFGCCRGGLHRARASAAAPGDHHPPEARLPRPGASTAPELRLPRPGALHRAQGSATAPWCPPPRRWCPPPRSRLDCLPWCHHRAAGAPHRAAGAPHRAARHCTQPLGLRPGAPGCVAIRASGVRRNWRGSEVLEHGARARWRAPAARQPKLGPVERISGANLGRGGGHQRRSSRHGANLGPGGGRQQYSSRASGRWSSRDARARRKAPPGREARARCRPPGHGGGRQRCGKGTRARRKPRAAGAHQRRCGGQRGTAAEARARWWRQGAAADAARSSGMVAGDHQEGAADPSAARGARARRESRASGGPPAAQTSGVVVATTARNPGGRGSRSSGTVEGATARQRHQGAAADTARTPGAVVATRAQWTAPPAARQPKLGHGGKRHQRSGPEARAHGGRQRRGGSATARRRSSGGGSHQGAARTSGMVAHLGTGAWRWRAPAARWRHQGTAAEARAPWRHQRRGWRPPGHSSRSSGAARPQARQRPQRSGSGTSGAVEATRAARNRASRGYRRRGGWHQRRKPRARCWPTSGAVDGATGARTSGR